MDCDVKVCFLWNIPFKFLSLLYTFLNFTTPIAKEKEIHSSNVFVQLWYQITLQRLWTEAGMIWDCELWWESLVKWKQNDAHGANIGILLEVSWQAWVLFLWVTGVAVGRSRGLGTGVMNGHHTDFLAQFHCEVVAQTRAYKLRVEQEWYHGSDIGLWQQRG